MVHFTRKRVEETLERRVESMVDYRHFWRSLEQWVKRLDPYTRMRRSPIWLLACLSRLIVMNPISGNEFVVYLHYANPTKRSELSTKSHQIVFINAWCSFPTRVPAFELNSQANWKSASSNLWCKSWMIIFGENLGMRVEAKLLANKKGLSIAEHIFREAHEIWCLEWIKLLQKRKNILYIWRCLPWCASSCCSEYMN